PLRPDRRAMPAPLLPKPVDAHAADAGELRHGRVDELDPTSRDRCQHRQQQIGGKMSKRNTADLRRAIACVTELNVPHKWSFLRTYHGTLRGRSFAGLAPRFPCGWVRSPRGEFGRRSPVRLAAEATFSSKLL